MKASGQQDLNQTAYCQLRNFINQDYAAGRFVAISAGEIVAEAASFDQLNRVLKQTEHETQLIHRLALLSFSGSGCSLVD